MVLSKLYPDEKKNISGYEKIFNNLKAIQPKESDLTIKVNWEKDDFDQTDYVHVFGYYSNPRNNPNEHNSLGIEFTPWEEWLGMDMDKETLQTFSELDIISHCLYEMTFFGFDEEDIQTELGKINDSVEEIRNMTDEERMKKLKSWEDLRKE